jgi:hypothetical protein
MKGPEWVVPVVVLIVWLISTIMKSREKAEPVRRRAAGEGGRKSTGDIDKFLEEIDRLRRKSAEEQSQKVRPAPRVRPVSPAVPRVRPARPISRSIEAPAVEAVPVVTPAHVAVEYVPPTAAPARLARPAVADLRQSVGATAALHLLRSPRTLAGAVVLQEVLGPPKCKR